MSRAVLPWILIGAVFLPHTSSAGDAGVDFARDVLPILSDACIPCHGPDEEGRKAELRLDNEAGLFGELDSGDGAAFVPGSPEKSVAYQLIIAEKVRDRMPPRRAKKTLTPEQIETVRKWIESGAEWQRHWAFVAPSAPELPAVDDETWPRNPIDRYVLARLEAIGRKPSPEASPLALLRRVTLDLTGLPPTLEEVDAYLTADPETRYEQAIDRLLGTEAHAEHMARYWLDAARYGDTHGLHLDNFRQIWPYRDWVIDAFRRNLPFDQFSIEQLAGDLLPEATPEQQIATGFSRCNVTTSEGGVIPAEYDVHYTVDRVSTVSTVWMGVTMGCVRCHEHKFDPFDSHDFYGLYAFFNSLDGPVMDGNKPLPGPVLSLSKPANRARIQELSTRLNELKELLEAQGDGGSAAELKSEQKRLNEEKAQLEADGKIETLVWRELAEPRPAHILIRGDYDKPGDPVERRTPSVLPDLAVEEGRLPSRLDLARWLFTDEHPLTSRVTVNRFWQQIFGVGLVKTADDFGTQGELPTHPLLLDWLACEFRAQDWDVRWLLKTLVTSATYRQTSKASPEDYASDRENRLLARGARFRFDAEVVRDTALAASGLLVRTVGGPSVRPYQPPGIWEAVGYTDSNTAKYKRDSGDALYRRSLYTFWKRTAPPPSLVALDAPSRENCVVRRSRTNTPLAALTLMNDEQFVEASRCLGQRMMQEGGATEAERAAYGFRLVATRRPAAEETDVLVGVYRENLARFRADEAAAGKLIRVGESEPLATLDACELAAWTVVGNLLLNLDETITRE